MTTMALVLLVSLALWTLVTEDVTCITAGVLVAHGTVGFVPATVACAAGIFLGDMLLFGAGRLVGRAALGHAPLKWFLKEADVVRCSEWLEQRGGLVIALSRVIPGTRLPTYFAAGALDTSAPRFAGLFLLATAVWTPVLVGLAAVLGDGVLRSALATGRSVAVALVAAVVLGYALVWLVIRLSSRRGRQLLAASVARTMRWEFWPPWVFYPPVVWKIVKLAIRHRSLTVFTAANPAIPEGGFVGESKYQILAGLDSFGDRVARTAYVAAGSSVETRVLSVRLAMRGAGLSYPVVLKPDVGQRGDGVAIVRSTDDVRRYFATHREPALVQEYVPGEEVGVFYYRYPDEPWGHVFAITDKRFPVVLGDGVRTLEQLILDDLRARLMAKAYFAALADRLWTVPAAGEPVQLVELGTHCRGAVFLDGDWMLTEEIGQAIDALSKRFEGFFFGRYDIRVGSIDAFRSGNGFKVVELNGVTSEATSIYDPRYSVIDAWRKLGEQWRIAFEIGAANRARGVRPASVATMARRIGEFAGGRV
ncbi:MAG TPA: VTT domain-containing protein, partial [Blastocatellia bacterium]|nr:VTT domain-containing protein [Blastocatellia bacterium]